MGWSEKTDADLLTPAQALAWKEAADLHIVGVMGYSGAWRRSGRAGEALAGYVAEVHAALRRALAALEATWGARLVMCSGATDIGVPGAAYRTCEALGIAAMGVTAAAALRYPLAPMAALVVVGRRFGDESATFVSLCDAFVLLGGGAQSLSETRAAHRQGKPITLLAGFGGAADQLADEGLPGARVVGPQPGGSPRTPPSGR